MRHAKATLDFWPLRLGEKGRGREGGEEREKKKMRKDRKMRTERRSKGLLQAEIE